MEVIIAEHVGFCPGVRRAVALCENLLKSQNSRVFTSGPLLHNEVVVKRLAGAGVQVLTDAATLKPGDHVVSRIHGITAKQKEAILHSGATFHDATCPVVAQAQCAVKEALSCGAIPLIAGDPGHVEVLQLAALAAGKAKVICTPQEAERLPPLESAVLVAQTTASSLHVSAIAEVLSGRCRSLRTADTLCKNVLARQQEVRRLARQVEAVVVVGDPQSANTRRLYEVASEHSARAFFLQGPHELNPHAFGGASKVAVTGGASTPLDLVTATAEALKALPET